jgi:hypothetical protein
MVDMVRLRESCLPPNPPDLNLRRRYPSEIKLNSKGQAAESKGQKIDDIRT